MPKLSVPDRHRLKIARDSMPKSCAGLLILGGPNHKAARDSIMDLTGKWTELERDCTCK